MKTQIISNLKKQKAWTFFFLTLLKLKKSDAGQSFSNCLKSKEKDTTSYDILLNIPFNGSMQIYNNNAVNLCCDKAECLECLPSSSSYFNCRKTFEIFNNIFCIQYPSNCIGFIGNNSITENRSTYGANCSISPTYKDKFDLAQNLINAGPIIGLDQDYALYNCSASDYCLKSFCGWDNGGWLCYSHVDAGQDYCYMQWTAPFPKIQNTTPIKPESNTNNHLVEKIAIPVGTVSGVSIASFLTYCFCKKKKRRKQDLSNNQINLNDNNLESEEIHSPSPVVNNNFLTPLESPNSLFDKEQLIKQLELELVGKEQLWNNYLELNNLLLNHSQSQFIYQNFSQLQNELLKTFTIDDLNLLLENENNKQVRNPHTEYFEIKEEARNPQEINSLTPITDINYHNQQSEHFEVRDPQGIQNYSY